MAGKFIADLRRASETEALIQMRKQYKLEIQN